MTLERLQTQSVELGMHGANWTSPDEQGYNPLSHTLPSAKENVYCRHKTNKNNIIYALALLANIQH